MFAGAAREAVFSNADVARRAGEEFVPVAIKAGRVANPPDNDEGRLYRQLRRTQPAPQGICVVNSSGKVLAWALMFDDDKSVLGFLDHGLKRYAEFPDAKKTVDAERFMKYPSQPMPSVEDDKADLPDAARHKEGERCFATPGYPEGTLVGRVYGRTFKDGKPFGDARRQEHYIEDRFELSAAAQETLVKAASDSFALPDELARTLVGGAYLGMLDVNPLGSPGGRNDHATWELRGKKDGDRIRIEGNSEVAGGQSDAGRGSDGRMWEHEVKLTWKGVIELKGNRIVSLFVTAVGNEKLRWGNTRMIRDGDADVAHLPGGRPIDLQSEVRYGLIGAPVAADEIGPGETQGPPASLQKRMKRLQELVQKRQGDLDRVQEIMSRFEPLMRDGKFQEAEAVLEKAIKKLEE